MCTQLPMKFVLWMQCFRWHLLSCVQSAFDEKCFSILYSNFSLALVRQVYQAFNDNYFFCGYLFFSLVLVSQYIDSFRLILFALCIQCFHLHSLCYD